MVYGRVSRPSGTPDLQVMLARQEDPSFAIADHMLITAREDLGHHAAESPTTSQESHVSYSYNYACGFVLVTTSGMPCVQATAVLLRLRKYSASHTSVHKCMECPYFPIDDFFHAYWLRDRTTSTREMRDARW